MARGIVVISPKSAKTIKVTVVSSPNTYGINVNDILSFNPPSFAVNANDTVEFSPLSKTTASVSSVVPAGS